MKTCHVCGALVDDRELTCPECGATVVKRTEGMTLRIEEPVKKKVNPMGTSISTGSGLTDILRSENDDYESVDDEFFGSMPTSLGREYVETSVKKKSDTGKVFGTVFKIILVLAAAYGIFLLVTKVFMKTDAIESYDAALECYVEALEKDDVSAMEKIMPPYVSDANDEASKIVSENILETVSKYDVITKDQLDEQGIVSLQDEIKMNSTKTANIKEAYTTKIRVYGTTISAGGSEVEYNTEYELVFLRIRDNWYVHVE